MNAIHDRTRLRAAGLAFALIAASAGANAFAQADSATQTEDAAATPSGMATERIIAGWPKEVQATARLLIERYGQPSMTSDNRLMWTDNGPWRRTVLYRDGLTSAMLGNRRDHLEQVIAYRVPEDKVAELQRFDKRVEVNRDAGELSSRADSESMNFLALNLADDIVKGQRTAQGARGFYRKISSFEKAGKKSPYLEGLVFAASSRSGEYESEKSTATDSSPVKIDDSIDDSRPMSP